VCRRAARAARFRSPGPWGARRRHPSPGGARYMSSNAHDNAIVAKLRPLRELGGERLTTGLDDATLARFAGNPDLQLAAEAAVEQYGRIKDEFAELLDLDEREVVCLGQAGFVNFYPDDSVNPYVAQAARGPWIVTLKGAVLHDSGGYGMLGFGHAPASVIEAMARPQALANIMTPSVSQLRFERAIRKAIGVGRECPYSNFLCLNSGSES